MPQTPASPLFENERQSRDKAREVEQTLDANAREKAQKAEQE